MSAKKKAQPKAPEHHSPVQRAARHGPAPRGGSADLSRPRPGLPVGAALPEPLTVQRCGPSEAVQRCGPAADTVQRHCGSATGCDACRQAGATIADIARHKDQGHPLPPAAQSLMGARFGADFSAVRLHTDERAAGAADRLNARAFTMGRDVFFARGQYEPATTTGQGLLAHELTHVLQQRAGRRPAGGIDTPGDAYEKEAEAAAQAVMGGRSPIVTTPGSPPGPQRAPKNALVNVTGPELVIPGTKVTSNFGDRAAVEKQYQDKAKAGALRTTHPGDFATWSTWRLTRPFDVPKTEAEARKQHCQVDHIVERQLGGEHRGDNLRLLGKSRNASAGSTVKNRIEQARAAAGVPANAVAVFAKVRVEDPIGPDPECLDWELSRRQGAAGRTLGTAVIEAQVAGLPSTIGYYTASNNIDPRSRYVVGGFRLDTARGDPAARSEITGALSEKGRIPFLKNKKQSYTFEVLQPKGALTQVPPKTLLMAFPFLSEAKLDMGLRDGGLLAEGSFRPTLPLLRHVDVFLRVEKETLTGGVRVPPEKLKQALPVPGLEITDVTMAIAVREGQFSASGGFGVKYSSIATGRVEAKLDKNGFSAEGRLDLHIPGLDTAQGKVWVRQGRLGGEVRLSAADLKKIPGVRSADFTALIQDGVLSGAGKVQLAVPGIKQGTLAFAVDKAGNHAIAGRVDLSIPGLKEAGLGLALRNGDLEGAGRIGLAVPGLETATFDLRYAKGQLSGAGRLAYRRGKLAGVVDVALSPKHKLSGGGELSYEIAPGLIAFAGMQVTEDGKTKISGGLRVPETITLFPPKKVEKTIFKLPTLEIPLLAIPLGTRSAGLVATIDAGLVGRATIGPGQLRKVKLLAELDPASPESSFAFQAAAELHVPASAEVALTISGGLGLSVAIARVVGGLTAEAAAGLTAEFVAATELKYQNGQFSVAGVAELSATPKLTFRLKAFVRAEADLFVTTIELYRKDWVLADKEVGSALRVGVRLPFSYVFGKPFAVPADQIQFIVPPVSPGDYLKQLLPT